MNEHRRDAAALAPPTGAPSSAHASALDVLETVLNSLDALVYVSDFETYELLFVSRYGMDIWGRPDGRLCYQYLQAGQTAPCAFCTNHRLLDADGQPTGVLVWEFQNTVTRRWYQCRDQAIRWVDGRLVRLEIATDITDRKQAEELLAEAHQRAEELARVDSLTKALNRRAFYEHMQALLSQLARKPSAACLAMLDLDHFKQINDTHGHVFGDEVLVRLSQLMRDNLRGADQLFRLGGEEFVLLLRDTDSAAAMDLTERLRLKVAELPLHTGQQRVSVTCSFGVAELQAGDGIDTVLTRADEALYAAKAGGRNQSRLAGHPTGRE